MKNHAWVIPSVLLAALGWAAREIHSVRRANEALIAKRDAEPRQRSAVIPAPQGRPPASTRPDVSTRSSSGGAAKQHDMKSERKRPGTVGDLISMAAPEVLPDGRVVIGKGTPREIIVTEKEAAELSAGLAKATADARNRGPNGASYSAGKATGAPDGPNHGGDSGGAWCPGPRNGSNEWLQLKYAKNVEISEINIHETYATGALAKVTAMMPDGSERELWSGSEPVETPPVERVLKVPPGIRADQIRITMDGTRINNWQEIDAVEIVGKDGSRQWATEATASSYWGSGSGWGAGYVEATRWNFRRL